MPNTERGVRWPLDRCELCNEMMPAGRVWAHADCADEWDRRESAGICTKCKADTHGGGILCDTCVRNRGPHVGYPPE